MRRPLALLLAASAGAAGGAGCGDAEGPPGAAPGPPGAAGAATPATVAAEAARDAEAADANAADAAAEPARSLRLVARRELALPAKPTGLVALDADGDGRDELVATLREPGLVALWRGGAPLGERPALLRIGDFPLPPSRLAGEDAVVVASQSESVVLVVELAADGPREARRAKLDDAPRALAAGVDARGDEVVAVGTEANELVLLDAALAERARATLPDEVAGHPRALSVAPLGPPADGGVLAVVGSQVGRAAWLVPLGAAAGAEPVRVALGGIPRASAAADLDGDGDLELAIAGGDRSVWVLGLGRGGGADGWIEAARAGPPRELVAPGVVPLALAPADLAPEEGGARDELVVIDRYTSGYGVLALGPEGGRTLARGYAGQLPAELALGDLDGDGALELAVANTDARRVSLFRGVRGARGGTRFEEAPRVATGENPTRVARADLDGDGFPDLVVVNAGEGTFCVRRNAGGRIVPEGPTAPAEPPPRAVAGGDLDGDGADEAVLLLQDAGEARVLVVGRGDGDGLAARGAARRVGRDVRDVLVHGGALLAADAGAGALAWTIGERSGTLALPAPAALAPLDERTAAVLVDRGAEGPAVVIVELPARGDAAGEPRVVGLAPARAPDRFALDVAAADVDGDGARDLVVLAAPTPGAPGTAHVLLRRGEGFEPLAPVGTGLMPQAVAAGDLDGDGRAEVLVAAQNSHVVNLWTPVARAGAPLALEEEPGLGAGLGPLDVLVADLDRDGRPEVVVANAFGNDLSILHTEPGSRF